MQSLSRYKPFLRRRVFYALASWSALLFAPAEAGASLTGEEPLSAVRSVRATEVAGGTRVKIVGNGEITHFESQVVDSPPRIVVDVPCRPKRFKSRGVALANPLVARIRLGYHPGKIRAVLDIKAETIPEYEIISENNELRIFVKSDTAEEVSPEMMEEAGQASERSAPPESRRERADNEPVISSKAKPVEDEERETFSDPVKPGRNPVPTVEALSRLEAAEDGPAGELFGRARRAFRDRRWNDAVKGFKTLLEDYPAAEFAERAGFLLAAAYDELHSKDRGGNLVRIRSQYEDVIGRFPESKYVSSALLAIGNLLSETENHPEALGYYNFVIQRDDDDYAVLQAYMKKGKILRSAKKPQKALAAFKYVAARYPGTSSAVLVRLEISKILYDLNAFQESSDLLRDLRREGRENLYRHPEILQYLGYNFFQLGEYETAREHLLRFYNTCPDRQTSNLVLTKAADTYLEEGRVRPAAKLYMTVIDRFSGEEGVVISLIRLAELQEKYGLKKEEIEAPFDSLNIKAVGAPQEIYRHLLEDFDQELQGGPLLQLALFKLGDLYREKGEYQKSLAVLKKLLLEYPATQLRDESKQALNESLGGILKELSNKKQFREIIEIYRREKKLVALLGSAEVYLPAARAFVQLGFEDAATLIYKQCDSIQAKQEKPSDLVLNVSRDLIKSEKSEEALEELNFLLANGPSPGDAFEAYRLKGRAFLRQGRFGRAIAVFSRALDYETANCARIAVSMDMAEALLADKQTARALKAIDRGNALRPQCRGAKRQNHRRMARLYLQTDKPAKALSVLKDALKVKQEENKTTGLELMIGECYEALGEYDSALDAYRDVVKQKKPFWSKVAREGMENSKLAMELSAAGYRAQ